MVESLHLPATVFAFASACLLALVLTPLVRRLACSRRVEDPPGDRKVHSAPRPHIGGLALVAALLPTLLILHVAFPPLPAGLTELTRGLMLASALVAVLGLIDDLRGSRPAKKLVVQAVAILLLQLQVDVLGWGAAPGLGWMLAGSVVALGWMLGTTNAMNLIDGLDGLASGVAAITGIGLVILGWTLGQPLVAIVAAALVGAALGFLRSNAHPAKIFMGDTGSMFLGFVVATLGAQLFWSRPSGTLLLSLLFLTWVPTLDIVFAVVRRVAEGRSIFTPDRGHLHHRLLDAGFSQRQASLALCGLSALGAAAGIQFATGTHAWVWAGSLLLATLPLAWVVGLQSSLAARTPAPSRAGTGVVSQDRAA